MNLDHIAKTIRAKCPSMSVRVEYSDLTDRVWVGWAHPQKPKDLLGSYSAPASMAEADFISTALAKMGT